MSTSQANSRIEDILLRVNSGNINKSEAFNELKGVISNRQSTATNQEERENVSIQNTTKTAISTTDRKTILAKIIEKKRQSKMAEQLQQDPIANNSFQYDPNMFQMYSPEAYQTPYSTPLPYQYHSTNQPQTDESGYNPSESDQHQNYDSDSGSRGSIGTGGGGGVRTPAPEISARSSRMAHIEKAIRDDMFKEFTFTPQIKTLPRRIYHTGSGGSSGGPSNPSVPFQERAMKWHQQKEQHVQEVENKLARDTKAKCSFQPSLQTSGRALREKQIRERGGRDKEWVGDRLYKSMETSLQEKERLIEQELIRERDRELENCTFSPVLHTSPNKFGHVSSKISHRGLPNPSLSSAFDQANKAQQEQERKDKECTFRPKIKGISNQMNSAKLYLGKGVVDRLYPSPPRHRSPSSASVCSRDSNDSRGSRGSEGSWGWSGGIRNKKPADRSGRRSSGTGAGDRSVLDVSSFIGSLKDTSLQPQDKRFSTPRSLSRPNPRTPPSTSSQSSRRGSTGSTNRPSSAPSTRSQPSRSYSRKNETSYRDLDEDSESGRSTGSVRSDSFRVGGRRGSHSGTPNSSRPGSARKGWGAEDGRWLGGADQGGHLYSTLGKKKGDDDTDTASLSSQRSGGLKTFLQSQEQFVLKRDRKLQNVCKQMVPEFKPALDGRSRELSNRVVKGDFLERTERDTVRRWDNEDRALFVPDNECTFRPSILSKSEALRPRSAHELSREDMLRRENNLRVSKLKREEEFQASHTFQPHISTAHSSNPHLQRSQSVLRQHDNTLTEWHQRQLEKKRDIAEREKKAREEAELSQCTFRPKTKSCPSYVRRIADSMRKIKKSQEIMGTGVGNKEEKPTWR